MANPILGYRIEQSVQENFKESCNTNMQEPRLVIQKFMTVYSQNPKKIMQLLDAEFKPQD